MNRDQYRPRSNSAGHRQSDRRRRKAPSKAHQPHRSRPQDWDNGPMTAEELEKIRQQREMRMHSAQQYRQESLRREKRKEQQVKRHRQKKKTARWEKRRQQTQRAPAKPLARRKLVIKLVTALAVVLALTLGMSIFFKIQHIRVTGNGKYSAEEIIAAAGVEPGENLLTFGRSGVAGRILAELPYVGDVQIGIKLPDTVNIDIVELTAAYTIVDTTGQWWLADSSGKLLEKAGTGSIGSHIQIVGIEARDAAAGQIFAAADDGQPASEESMPTGGESEGSAADRYAAALEIMDSISAADRSGEITVIDVSNLYDLRVFYGDAYEVRLSGPTDLDYKIRYMTQAVGELMAEGYRGGVLDLSFREAGKAIFTPW